MQAVVRLAGYAGALALAFGAAWAAGSGVRAPAVASAAPVAPSAPQSAAVPPAPDPPASDPIARSGDDTRGLAATAAGYTLLLPNATFTAGRRGELTVTVAGPDNRPVRAFETGSGGEQLHLLVVRRDTAGFQHLHPQQGADGSWRAPLALPAAGVYRLYAQFAATGGPELVLGTDLYASGDFRPVGFAPSRVARAGDYQVRLDGELVPGRPSQVFATVSRDGVPVADLQPHRGAFGHLVALRRFDLAYVPARPDVAAPSGTDRSGPGIAFTVDVPTAGGYRLYLDFSHDGVVRTAEFTLDTRDGA